MEIERRKPEIEIDNRESRIQARTRIFRKIKR